MKVLLVISGNINDFYGGGQVYIKNIIDSMIDLHFDINILSINKEINSLNNIEKYRGIYVYYTDGYENTIRIIKNINPDIIHAHSEKRIASEIAQKLNIPCIITVHHAGLFCPSGALLNENDNICNISINSDICYLCCIKKKRFGKMIIPIFNLIPKNKKQQIGYFFKKIPSIPYITPILTTYYDVIEKIKDWEEIKKNTSYFISPSYLLQKSLQNNGVPQEKNIVLPHGIPIINLIKNENINIYKNEDKNKVISFFYLGRICYEKGIHIMLKAFSLLNYNAELNIIGGPGNKWEKKYENKLKNKYTNIKNKINWQGVINPNNVVNYISKYDILLHPTICLEAFGLNISESLSLGKPVIATRCGGAEMQIKDNINGLLVEPNDYMSLFQAMKIIIENKELINKFKKNTKNYVIPINEHVILIEKIYQKCRE
jgi:glycosyltransferase involved in cell wall biosynthesis